MHFFAVKNSMSCALRVFHFSAWGTGKSVRSLVQPLLIAKTAQQRALDSSTLVWKIARFLLLEMENVLIENEIVVENAMDVLAPAEEQSLPKKPVSIIDTRTAIRPYKLCADGLEAFVQACNRKKTGVSTPEMFGIHFKRVVQNKTLDPPQVDHFNFIKFYDITLECKQERSVSTFVTSQVWAI